MKIQLNNITPATAEKWSAFVNRHPRNTVFQSPEIFRFFQKVDHYEPNILIAYEDERILAVLLAVVVRESGGLLGYFSSRAIVYGGPLILEGYPEKLQLLDGLLKKLSQSVGGKSIFIQFRNFFGWTEKEKQVFKKNGFVFRDRINLIIDTTDEQRMLHGISKSKRRQIRLGFKNGTSVRPPQSMDEVSVFYGLLFDLYKNKVKKPLPPWEFFREFYNNSLENKLGIIRLLTFEEKIIGGVLAAVTPGKTIYELYIVGLDKTYKKNYPSVLATWALMDYALQNNLQRFDFMGLGKPDEPYSVRDFKMKFGKNIVNYGRFGKINNKALYLVAELGYNLLRLFKKV